MKIALYALLVNILLAACEQHPGVKSSQPLSESDLKSNTAIAKGTRLYMDELKSSPANFKLLLDNSSVRVLEYHLDPGQKDSIHTHPPKTSYVVSGGKLKVYLENGDTLIADEVPGTASWSDYLGKHQVENIGSTTVKIILTEFKPLQ